RLYPAKNNLVRDLISDLRNVFAGYGLSENGGAIKFLALDRLNAVLVITGNPENFAEVERRINSLDQPLATAGIRNYVYRVKNNKAQDLQILLNNLYAPVRPAGAVSTVPGPLPQQPIVAATTPFSALNPPPPPAGSEVVSSAAVGTVRV